MKKNTLLWKTVLVAVGLFLGLQTSFAQGVFTSAANGNWNEITSWTFTGSDADGIPDADDNVTIVSTHIITVSASTTVECYDLTVAGAAATSLTMAGANSIVNIYGTLVATTAPTAGNYIDCTADATAKVVFKRNTTGPIISATGWGAFGEKVRIEVNVGSGVEAQVTPIIKFREIIVSSGTLTCSANVLPDEGSDNTGKVTIQDGAVFKCVQLKRVGNDSPFNSLTINGTGRLIFTGTSATSTPTVQSGYPIYTFSNDAVIEYQGLNSKIANISFPNLVINAGAVNPATKTWDPTANNVSKSITITRGTLSILSGSNTVNGNIIVNSTETIITAVGAVLNVSAGAKVTNNGTITNNGSFNFLSDATNGTATFMGNAISGSGTINIKHNLTSGRNWYISNPISTMSSSSLPAGTLWKYNEPNTGITASPGTALWDNITSAENLEIMSGYVFKPTSSGDITFTGTLNTGDKSITIYRTENANAKRGFNLIGNPYLSYINIDNLALNTDLEPTIWYRSYNSGYVNDTYNIPSALSTGLSGKAVSKFIPPMQAFWVRVANTKASAAVNLLNANRDHADNVNNKYRAPAVNASVNQVVRLKVESVSFADEAIIYFNANASNNFDIYDSPKMFNNSSSVPEIYTQVGDEKLVINGMKTLPLNQEIGLGFIPSSATSFSIKANEISNLPSDVKVILKDNATLAEIDLTDGTASYQFTPQTSSGDRFCLIFRAAETTTSVNNVSKLNAHVFVNAANQLVINAVEKTTYSIYNAVGMLIMNGQTTAKLQTVNYKLNTGVYVVELSDNGQREIKKVIIR